ncbi:glycosyltransferase [Microbacterium lacus]|uniref:glycosyltransferase n=1 Tax=Microbacterium lacus TaxID=415217 RepID=UPI00384E9640
MTGGAEYALLRMLQRVPQWRARLLLAPDGAPGVFVDLHPDVETAAVGVAQKAGASSGGLRTTLTAAVRVLAQSVVVARHPLVRSADIVDANTARAAVYGALAVRATRARFVVHVRDIVDTEALGVFGYRAMTRLALPRADGIVANSRATLDSVRPFLRADALAVVIPSASGLGRSAGTERPPGPIRVGMLARIAPWKGQLLLLESFADALGGSDAVLEFAGAPLFENEEFLAELKVRAAELGLAGRVRFLGHVDHTTALLSTWDVAVQASLRAEALGQNVLQYLASGRATVVTDEGGPIEWVRHRQNGLVVAARDRDALAAALAELAADAALRARLGSTAAATPGLPDDATVTQAHADFYRELLTRGSARGR